LRRPEGAQEPEEPEEPLALPLRVQAARQVLESLRLPNHPSCAACVLTSKKRGASKKNRASVLVDWEKRSKLATNAFSRLFRDLHP
jgi:hypothetical protein